METPFPLAGDSCFHPQESKKMISDVKISAEIKENGFNEQE